MVYYWLPTIIVAIEHVSYMAVQHAALRLVAPLACALLHTPIHSVLAKLAPNNRYDLTPF